MESGNIIVSVIYVIIPAIVTLLINYFQRKRDAKNDIKNYKNKKKKIEQETKTASAELTMKYQEIASKEAEHRIKLEERLNKRIDDIKDALDKNSKLLRVYIKGSEKLYAQIISNDGKPSWIPPHIENGDKVAELLSARWD